MSHVDGSVLWKYQVTGEHSWLEQSQACIGNDGIIYFTSDTFLYALTSQGEFKWRTKLTTEYTPYDGMDVESQPVIGPDGTVYVCTWFRREGSNYTDIGYLHAIGGVEIHHPEEEYLHIFGEQSLKTFYDNTIIIGPINIQAEVFDEQAVQHVKFFIDGIPRSTDTTPPYEWHWKFDSLFRHRHKITVIAELQSGEIWQDSMMVWRFL